MIDRYFCMKCTVIRCKFALMTCVICMRFICSASTVHCSDGRVDRASASGAVNSGLISRRGRCAILVMMNLS